MAKEHRVEQGLSDDSDGYSDEDSDFNEWQLGGRTGGLTAVLVAAVCVAVVSVAAASFWLGSHPPPPPAPVRALESGPKRIAVLMAGTMVRYFSNLDTHVVKPLVESNHSVDVYLSLSVEQFKSWRQEADSFQLSPEFQGKSVWQIEQLITSRIKGYGGGVGALETPSDVELTPAGQEFVENGSWWTRNAESGSWLNQAHARTTRRNVMKLFMELKRLWDLAKEAEAKLGQNYTHVLIFRDDSNWIADLDLDLLLATGGRLKLPGQRGYVYSVLCDPSMSKWGCNPDLPRVNDYVILAERRVAEPFGNFYTMIADPASMGYELNANDYLESELYVYAVAQAANVWLEQVPAALFPFQRCGRLLVNNTLHTCLHKPCDSALKGVSPLNPRSYVEHECSKLQKHHKHT